MKQNPNAAAVGGTSLAAAAVAWAAHKLGFTIDSYYAILIAGVVSTGVLWIGRQGIRGALRRIWDGPPKEPGA